MAKPNPIMFVASGRQPRIGRRKVSASDRRYASIYGQSFHETWEEAHAALIARLESKVASAQREAQQRINWAKASQRELEKARALRNPDGGADGAKP